jgi:hypothetical protein
MSNQERQQQCARSSRELLRAISEAQEVYDRRYKELIGEGDERDKDDAAASWLAVLRGPDAGSSRRA